MQNAGKSERLILRVAKTQRVHYKNLVMQNQMQDAVFFFFQFSATAPTSKLSLLLFRLARRNADEVLSSWSKFPVTAALVGIYVFNSNLRWTQWVGVAITVAVVTLLPWRRREVVRMPPLASAPAAG